MKSNDQLVHKRIELLKPYPGNARTHSKRQVRQIADSIQRFGFNNPVLIGDDDEIIAGHGRVLAAKLLGWIEVPTLLLSHLTSAERRAYVIADNKLALNAGWDEDLLAIELQGLIDLDFDVELTGFSVTELDFALDASRERKCEDIPNVEDIVVATSKVAVSRRGDIWQLGRHRLICGDARDGADYSALLGDDRVDILFTDPPYNVPIEGHVSGLGRVRHREFAMGVGEMSKREFTNFLFVTLGHAAAACRDGAICYVCMDWRHIGELVTAGETIFSELKNICVWNKTNGGMGTFYRSKHEFIAVFKRGESPHVNNFGLGDTGRYRTNVWDYPGISSIGPSRDLALSMHPTVKPTALVADALRDCSKRGGIVLDPFAGSGTTLIAAESCGRTARLIEYDPLYCDTIIRRFGAVSGKQALLFSNGMSFDDVSAQRLDFGAVA